MLIVAYLELSVGKVPESIPNINDNANEENPFASSGSEGDESIKATLLVRKGIFLCLYYLQNFDGDRFVMHPNDFKWIKPSCFITYHK